MKILQRIASILLIVCLFLPLSKCTAKTDSMSNVRAADTYLYGYKMVGNAITDIKSGSVFHGITVLLLIFSVFVLPLTCIKLRTLLGASLLFLGSFVSAYSLYGWVFVLGNSAQVGGVVAIFCWVILFVTAIYEIGRWLFKLSDKSNGLARPFKQ